MDPVLFSPHPRSPGGGPGGHIHKAGQSLQDRWRSHIDAEHNSVDALIADSFKTLCQQQETTDNARFHHHRLRSDSFNSPLSSSTMRGRTGSGSSTSHAIADLYNGGGSTLSRSPAMAINSNSRLGGYSHHGTLPRNQKLLVNESSSCLNCGHSSSSSGSSFQLSSPPAHPGGVSWLPPPPPQCSSGSDSPVRRLSFSSQHVNDSSAPQSVNSSNQNLPAGIAELETMYRAMKNLSSPLPNAAPLSTSIKMPAVYPMHHSSVDALDNIDTVSVLGEIPPPPPPVQSHAVLESGLGHELPISPKTPGTLRKMLDWPRPPNIPLPLPPLPPKRTSSRLSDMAGGKPSSLSSAGGTNLNLSGDSSDTSIYSRPKPFQHRTSLMSTGSSDSGGSSSGGPASDPELPMSPLTPSSANDLAFVWPNYMISGSPDHAADTGSVCSGGGHSVCNTSMTSYSGVYVKMHPLFSADNPDSPYMNLLYSAVQQQGGKGSVESAMSPYLAMTGHHNNNPHHHHQFENNIKNLHNAALDSVSAIYAQIDSSKGSVSEFPLAGGKVTPPGLLGGKVTPSRDFKSRSPSNKSKALAEFRELMLEVERKRNFRVGLNLFNTHPDIGIDYMVKQGFLELSPLAVAKFLHSNQDLSKAKIGDYLGQLQNAFSMKVLGCFLENFDFAGLRVDKALRQFLRTVQIPGEAQKIEKIMEVFGKRYLKSNPGFASKLKTSDSIVTLACAVMLLNTDLHTPNLKPDKKMLEKDFMNNLKGADAGQDFDHKLLKSVYKGIKKQAFESGADHVTQTQLLRTRMSGKAPALAEAHRRLVCLCRLSEVADINTKKESEANSHARDIWLFNDMLLVTKVAGRNSGGPVYSYRDSFPLSGMEVTLFNTAVYKFGIQVARKADGAVVATLNASTEQDRYKFVMDLQESIFEMDLMNRALRDANMIK